MKPFFIFLSLVVTLSTLKAQVPIGQWQDYLSFYEVHSVEKGGNKIYAASYVGLFFYDTKEGVFEKITKLNGLSDVGVSAIKYHASSKILMVGYDNGKIDFISDKSISSLPDLFLKDMSDSKRINHIHFIGDKAFCSTDFGVVVVDVVKKEITETYIIGDNATNLRVNQLIEANDSVYVATKKGILGAPMNSSALPFYQTWKRVSNDDKEYMHLASTPNGIIAARANGTQKEIEAYFRANVTARINGMQVQLLEYKQGSWTLKFTQNNFLKFEPIEGSVAVVSNKAVDFYDYELNKTSSLTNYSFDEVSVEANPLSIYVDEKNTKWIGDARYGLVKVHEGGDMKIAPDGPVSNDSYRIKATANALWSVRGLPHQFSPLKIPAECSIYRTGKWKRMDKNTPELNGAYNLNDIAVDPTNENHVFISSALNGIFELEDDVIINQYTEQNSSLEATGSWRLVNGMAMDDKGNLFANNQSKSHPIIVKPKDVASSNSVDKFGWYRYNYTTKGTSRGETENDPWIHQIVHTSWGHFWGMTFHNPKGLFVFDISGTIGNEKDDRYRYAGDVNKSDNQKLLLWNLDGDEISTTVTCIAEDKSGYMWIGTTEGILVYYSPRQIFNVERPIARKIVIPRNDGTNNIDFLLEKEGISTIAIDGANRKWIGTNGSGVYLVSSDGTETIHAFNEKNSRLLSNNIRSISINPKSGEVFIATDKGIVSYRGTATEGEVSYSAVKAFPNPVNPNYDGPITVSGLVENSTVSITDISGKIVYRAISTGGQIVWNGKNVYSEKVSSGVYMVFATDKEGSEAMVTKIMVVR